MWILMWHVSCCKEKISNWIFNHIDLSKHYAKQSTLMNDIFYYFWFVTLVEQVRTYFPLTVTL